MSSIMVRPMITLDIPVLAGWISATSLWQHYGVTEAIMRTKLEHGLQKSDILLVSDIDQTEGQACGLVWCILDGAFGRSAYLRMLGVRANYTGLSIGASLLEQVERISAQHTNEMFLLVSDFNTDAQRFYQRHGYAQAGSVPGYVVPDVVELLYWKRLQRSR